MLRKRPWLSARPPTPPPEPDAAADQLANSPALTALADALAREGFTFAGRGGARG